MTTETTIKTDLGHRVYVSSYDGGGCWLAIITDNARIDVSLRLQEIDQLIKGLQTAQEAEKLASEMQDDYRAEKRAEGDDEVRESHHHADEVLNYEHK